MEVGERGSSEDTDYHLATVQGQHGRYLKL